MAINDLVWRWQKSPQEEITVWEWLWTIDFWESFPLNSWNCRILVPQILAHRNSVSVVAIDGKETSVLAEFVSKSADETQAYLRVSGIEPGMHCITFDCGTGRSTCFVNGTVGEADEIGIAEFFLALPHRFAGEALARDLERHDMNGAALIRSGEICRGVVPNLKNLGPVNARWPECLGENLGRLLLLDEVTPVVVAQDAIRRLRLRLENENAQMTRQHYGASGTSVVRSVKGEAAIRDSVTEARDKWIYEQAMKGKPWAKIRTSLNAKPVTWARLDTDNGVKRAAQAYATRHGLTQLPKRKAGRPPENTNRRGSV